MLIMGNLHEKVFGGRRVLMTALPERVTTLPTLLVLPPSFSNVSIPPKIKIDLPLKIDQSLNESLKPHLAE